MAVRDRVVRWTLGIGVLAALLSWTVLGPWPAMGVAVLALVVAGIAYRVEPSRIDVDRPDTWVPGRHEDASQRVDQ